jgi:hypothetical protein
MLKLHILKSPDDHAGHLPQWNVESRRDVADFVVHRLGLRVGRHHKEQQV